MKIKLLMLLLLVLCGCRKMTHKDAPSDLYDRGLDKEAIEAAHGWLDTKYDVAVRMFIVQFNLARLLETGDRRYANEISQYYHGRESLDWPSIRWNLNYDDFQGEAKYFDAAILLFVKNDRPAALALLNQYCPQPAHLDKIRCHRKNYDYFERNAHGGRDRNKQEIAFLADYTVAMAYQDHKMLGHAMSLLAEYDIDHAAKRIQPYLVRNADHDEVLMRYCRSVREQLRWKDEQPVFPKYQSAYAQANCDEFPDPEPER